MNASYDSENPIPPQNSPFDVVAIVTSAGGLEAMSDVLRDIPPDFPAAIVIAQHLGGQGSALVDILGRRTSLPVSWAEEGKSIQTGQITICPPRMCLEILPDRTCILTPQEWRARDRPLDALLESLADSVGRRTLGVVLTGMGKDGAAGARALKEAGGTILVQSEDTAAQPSMPRAVINNGSADLVLPLYEIGAVIADVVAGGRLPRPRTEIEAIEALFAGHGAARAALRAVDWSATALGPVTTWSQSLRTIAREVLDIQFPMIVFWGPEFIQIGNDAMIPSQGAKPMAGLPARVTWAEMWTFLGAQFEKIRRTGEAVYAENQLFEPYRHGFVEEAYFTYCYSPLYDDGAFAGVLCTTLETSAQVLAERRLATLHTLASIGTGADTRNQICVRAAQVLAANPQDIPFALFYLHDKPQSTLCGIVGVEAGLTVSPRTIRTDGGHPVWSLAKVLTDGIPVLVEDLDTRFRGFHAGPWAQSPTRALLLPLRAASDEPPVGVVILGISARLAFDNLYKGFFELIAAHISVSLSEAQARQKEHDRLERLAELDRTKTEFFSNVSHEFRTPLTLLLAPLEELLGYRDQLTEQMVAELNVATRNARRLLALVNTLLDFSKVEAGRLRAHFEETNLSALTADIVSLFRSAAERAGVTLRVEVPTASPSVWVDREMWEKIVSNLLSNALKFTFEGEILVELEILPHHAQLIVRDTGVGIPTEEIPHVFKRFHRVKGAQARTHEGTGIGLALVNELVRLHRGRVRVQSVEGQGTTFTVWIPLGVNRVTEMYPVKPIHNNTIRMAAALAEEAEQWDSKVALSALSQNDVLESTLDQQEGPSLQRRAEGARILVVDDNADMREYLRRLLAANWLVETAADGESALRQVRQSRPDLILTDVMMPHMDGFELLRQVRRDETLHATSVILVTARAGEEAAIEGLLAGADDYLAKPFSARELIARVGAQLELARIRRESEAQFRSLVMATSDIVYKMNWDWSEMRQLLGKNFIADTESPSRSWLETYIPVEDQPQVLQVIQAAIRTKSVFELEHRVRQVDGTLGWVFLRALPLLNAQNEIVEWIGAASDITERKLAETALRETQADLQDLNEHLETVMLERTATLQQSEERFRALVEVSAQTVWATDPEGRVVADSLSWRAFTGQTLEEWLGWGWVDAIHPDDRDYARSQWQHAVETQTPVNTEFRLRYVGGGWRNTWVRATPLYNPDGSVRGWIGMNLDLTNYTHAQNARRLGDTDDDRT